MKINSNGAIRKLSFLALSAALLCVCSTEGWAQSDTRSGGYGASAIANLRARSTGRGTFSVKGIQEQLTSRSLTGPPVLGGASRNFLGAGSSPLDSRAKPFSSVKRGPTVSPYLALSSPRASGSDYQSLIRPQQQRQRSDRQQQLLGMQQQRRLNQMAARAPYSATGDPNRAPTGHVAVFQSLGSYQNTGGYFPPPSKPKRR